MFLVTTVNATIHVDQVLHINTYSWISTVPQGSKRFGVIERSERCERNKQSELLSGLLKTRLSLTRNVPSEIQRDREAQSSGETDRQTDRRANRQDDSKSRGTRKIGHDCLFQVNWVSKRH